MSFFSSVSEQEEPTHQRKPEDVVFEKINKNSILSQKYTKQDIQSIACWLSNKKLFIENCLNLKWSETLLQLKNIKDDFEVDETISFIDIEKELTEKNDSEFSKSIPIKLLVTENLGELTKSARGIISPLLCSFNKSLEFGWFHVALVVGPWVIDWNDSELCIPRKCASKAAIITADIGAIATKKDIEDLVQKLAEIIVYWNVNMKYSTLPEKGKHKKSGNCQDFIDAVLTKIGIQPTYEGALDIFMKRMKNEGISELVYETNSSYLKNTCMIKSKTKFSSHKELDLFVINMMKNLDFQSKSIFEKNLPGDFSLLKSFDRALWLRHLSLEKDSKFFPYEEDGKCLCPFDDPRDSHSMIREKDE